MGRKQKQPTEDDSVVAARERQILDLAKLDEEENRRIKQMRTVSRGVRAFRAVRGSTARGSVGSTRVGGGTNSGGGGDAGAYQNQIDMLNQYMR